MVVYKLMHGQQIRKSIVHPSDITTCLYGACVICDIANMFVSTLIRLVAR